MYRYVKFHLLVILLIQGSKCRLFGCLLSVSKMLKLYNDGLQIFVMSLCLCTNGTINHV